ncbi:MAG: Bug family tripartite tricarboxylate transporter substrate binding protein [Lautropia sp.]
MKVKLLLKVVTALHCMMLLPGSISAQSFPTKPIRLIVPFPTGGGTDLVGRTVGQRMGALLGQQVVADNRAGAGGMIGVEAAARSAPDGHTIVIAGVGELTMFPSLYRKLPYDPLKDLQPLGLIAVTPQLLVVNTAVIPTPTLRDFIAFAKANPHKINYGTYGLGSLNHVMMELFASQAGIKLTAIPYKGSAPAITDLMGGQIAAMILAPSVARGAVNAGKLHALGATTRERIASMPDVPTLHEAGAENYDAASWFGFLAPAGTPKDVVTTLHTALVRAVETPEVTKILLENGAIPKVTSPEEFGAFIRTETERWTTVIQSTGVKLD